MVTINKRKTIHYKKVVIGKNTPSLQALLTEALTNTESLAYKANNRREQINQDDDGFRLINHHKTQNNMIFGQLVLFETGKSQAFLTLDDDAEFYSIDAITSAVLDESSAEAKQKKKEFVDSMLYFGVHENHLVVMQSSALSSRELEVHLAWLLGGLVKSLGDNAIILQDKPSAAVIKKIEKSPVKSIKIGTPIEIETQSDADKELIKPDQNTAQKIKFFPKGMGASILGAVLGEKWFEPLNLNDSLDDANIKVSLEVTYLRKTTLQGQKIIDNIATSLRHLDEADVMIVLNGGSSIKGGELKLSGKINIKMNTKGLVDESDLYHQMHTWLIQQISNGEAEV